MSQSFAAVEANLKTLTPWRNHLRRPTARGLGFAAVAAVNQKTVGAVKIVPTVSKEGRVSNLFEFIVKHAYVDLISVQAFFDYYNVVFRQKDMVVDEIQLVKNSSSRCAVVVFENSYGVVYILDAGFESGLAGFEFSLAGFEFNLAGFEFSLTGFEFSLTGFEFSLAGFEFNLAGFEFSLTGFEFSLTGFEFSLTGFEFSLTGFEFSLTGFEFSLTGFEFVNLGIKLGLTGFYISDVGFQLVNLGYDSAEHRNDFFVVIHNRASLKLSG
jgi:hypothetical protein